MSFFTGGKSSRVDLISALDFDTELQFLLYDFKENLSQT